MNRLFAAPLAVIGVLCGSYVLVSSLLGLGDAEALYFCYSRHLSLAYLDHPPLIGWLIAVTTFIGGNHTLSVRAVSVVAMVLSVLFTFFLTRDAFGEKAARWAVLLLFATPVFSVGMVAAAPDAPLAALWTLFTWQLYRQLTVESDGPWHNVGRPLLLGLVLGLSFLAKYTAVCLVITAVLMVAHRPNRFWLRRPVFYATALVAAVTACPVLLWNAANGWAGLHHRLVWTQADAGFSLGNVAKLLGGQLLYLGPFTATLFVLAVVDAGRRLKAGVASGGERLLLATAVPTLALMYVLCSWSRVAEPHWPAAGYLALFPLTAAFVGRSGPGVRRLAKITVGFGAAVFLAAHLVVLTPLVPRLTPADRYVPAHDISNELRGWPEVAETLRALDPGRLPVVAAFYTQCSQLAFALSRDDDPEVRCASPEIDDFDLWFGPFVLPPGGAFFVSDNRFDHDVTSLFPDAVYDTPITIEITRGNRWIRRVSVTRVFPRR